MRILIIEDEESLSHEIARYFKKGGYTCGISIELEDAREKLMLYPYDCIILDIGLPDGNGLELLKLLQKEGKEDGVLILSAKDSLDDRVEGLKLGADDYLTKPFHFSELNARVEAIIRRRKFKNHQLLAFENIEIDLQNLAVTVNDHPLYLTRKEFDILQHLLANKDRVVSKISLAEYIWGEHSDQADNFDFLFAHVKNLRKKLQNAKANISIENIYNIGYKIRASCD